MRFLTIAGGCLFIAAPWYYRATVRRTGKPPWLLSEGGPMEGWGFVGWAACATGIGVWLVAAAIVDLVSG